MPAVRSLPGSQARFYLEREFDVTARSAGAIEAFEGYTLVDAAAGYRSGFGDRLSLGVMNLLDKRYITYFSDTRAPTGSITSDTTYFAGSRPDLHPWPDERVLG